MFTLYNSPFPLPLAWEKTEEGVVYPLYPLHKVYLKGSSTLAVFTEMVTVAHSSGPLLLFCLHCSSGAHRSMPFRTYILSLQTFPILSLCVCVSSHLALLSLPFSSCPFPHCLPALWTCTTQLSFHCFLSVSLSVRSLPLPAFTALPLTHSPAHPLVWTSHGPCSTPVTPTPQNSGHHR